MTGHDDFSSGERGGMLTAGWIWSRVLQTHDGRQLCFVLTFRVLLFEKSKSDPRMKRVVLECCGVEPLRSWGVQSCGAGRRLGPTRAEKNEPRKNGPLGAREGALVLKKRASGYNTVL